MVVEFCDKCMRRGEISHGCVPALLAQQRTICVCALACTPTVGQGLGDKPPIRDCEQRHRIELCLLQSSVCFSECTPAGFGGRPELPAAGVYLRELLAACACMVHFAFNFVGSVCTRPHNMPLASKLFTGQRAALREVGIRTNQGLGLLPRPQVRARSRRLHSSTAAGSLVLADQAQSATGAAFAERVHSDRSAVNRLACTVWGEHLVWLAGVHVQLEWACTVSQGHQRNKAMGPRPTIGERWAVAELRLVEEDDGGGDALQCGKAAIQTAPAPPRCSGSPANRIPGSDGVGHRPSPLLPCTCRRKASQERSSKPAAACLRLALGGGASRSPATRGHNAGSNGQVDTDGEEMTCNTLSIMPQMCANASISPYPRKHEAHPAAREPAPAM